MSQLLQSQLMRPCGAFLALFLAASCGQSGGESFVIEDVRTRSPKEASGTSSTGSRLGFEHHAPPLDQIADSDRAAAAGSGLRWEKPEGWRLGPGKQMRLVTFLPEEGAGTEIYISALPGHGGGMGANLNRWRGQMKKTPLSPSEIAALPKHEVLGQSAPLLDMEGEFQGMSGGAISGARFLGLVVELGRQTLFVKMTGPSAIVSAERARFLEFAESLRFESSGS